MLNFLNIIYYLLYCRIQFYLFTQNAVDTGGEQNIKFHGNRTGKIVLQISYKLKMTIQILTHRVDKYIVERLLSDDAGGAVARGRERWFSREGMRATEPVSWRGGARAWSPWQRLCPRGQLTPSPPHLTLTLLVHYCTLCTTPSTTPLCRGVFQ